MAEVSEQTTVVLTMKHALWIVFGMGTVVAGIVGTAVTGMLGTMKDDAAFTRQAVIALQAAERDTALKVRDTDVKLIEAVSQLRVTLDRLDTGLAASDTRMAGIDRHVAETANVLKDISGRLSDIAKVQARAINWSDPRVVAAFVSRLEKEGADGSKIVIIPADGIVPAPQ